MTRIDVLAYLPLALCNTSATSTSKGAPSLRFSRKSATRPSPVESATTRSGRTRRAYAACAALTPLVASKEEPLRSLWVSPKHEARPTKSYFAVVSQDTAEWTERLASVPRELRWLRSVHRLIRWRLAGWSASGPVVCFTNAVDLAVRAPLEFIRAWGSRRCW
eukprot:scaffold2729_cov403-Prasinococcus_capsulatus_cf.AAC.3